MNETTLNALINLFAIFSAISESKKNDAIREFNQYLELHWGISSNNEYINLFKELLDFYGVEGENEFEIDLHEQAKLISGNIKSRLHKDEQIMVFLRFLELSKSGNTQKAEQLFTTLAQVFEIPNDELQNFKTFIFQDEQVQNDIDEFLSVDSTEKENNRHIYQKNFKGKLLFLNSKLIGNYLFIFTGNDNITLEGNPILPYQFYAFKEGGIIRGNHITPIYYTQISSAFLDTQTSTSFTFKGDELEFKFKNSDNGLHRFSFEAHSGELIAVMGGSGVGKSTLLNILNGSIPVQHGKLTINQIDINKDKKAIEGLIGFVPQDDLLFEDLTVWENLYYNACLCFDELSDKEIKHRVDKILKELELSAFKDMKVGSPLKKFISGGQRKRLNVALELIREPSIMFVDEPTSGLSSTDSEKVMLLLKEQARKGKLIVVNIHQPSSAIFKLFDKLWIMDKGGRPIYTGNPLDAIIYFKTKGNLVNANDCECPHCGNVNPEQVLEIIETKKIDSSGNFTSERRFSPEYWYKQFREKNKDKKVSKIDDNSPKSEFKKPGLLKQLKIFVERNLQIKFTDKQYLLINLLEAPVLALIVGYFTRFSEAGEYLFFENKSLISYLFMAIVVLLFMGMSVSAEEIIKDRKILQRESFLNLSRLSYLNSKIIFLILLSAFQSLAFVVVGNLILGIHGMTFAYWMILFSVAVFSNMLGLNISSAFDSVVTIYILIPLLLIPQILLCGVIVNFDDLQNKSVDKDAIPIIGDLMVSRWAFEALAVEQFKNNDYMVHFFDVEKQMAKARYQSDILTTELIGQIDLVSGWQNLQKPEKDISDKLLLIKNEIQKLNNKNIVPSFKYLNEITPVGFNAAVADSTKSYLKKIKKIQSKRYQELRKQKDQIIYKENKENGKQYLYEQKLKYHNKSLEILLLNSNTKKYYRETPHGLMQKIAPIYKASDFNNGRAHFYASEKNFAGIIINTPVFNLAIIWLMCIILYVALYFDWLRKIIALPNFIKSFFK